MEDADIIALFNSRSEAAIHETQRKYGDYLKRIADNLLHCPEDTEEVLSDSYLRAWNAIPPARPAVLRHFLSRITRNLAIDRLKYRSAGSRSASTVELLDELGQCIGKNDDTPQLALETQELAESLNRFLSTLSQSDCALFLSRYYEGESVKEAARRYGLTERQGKYRLSLCRRKCKKFLMEEGYTL